MWTFDKDIAKAGAKYELVVIEEDQPQQVPPAGVLLKATVTEDGAISILNCSDQRIILQGMGQDLLAESGESILVRIPKA